jgi:hypothetical protein
MEMNVKTVTGIGMIQTGIGSEDADINADEAGGKEIVRDGSSRTYHSPNRLYGVHPVASRNQDERY